MDQETGPYMPSASDVNADSQGVWRVRVSLCRNSCNASMLVGTW